MNLNLKREIFHTRRIETIGYSRNDGFWDIESFLIDTRGYDISTIHRGKIPAGVALHEMRVCMTLNDDMEIMAIKVATDAAPYHPCPQITKQYQKLVGEKIQKGWTSRVKNLFKGIEGCTHITELIIPMATVAFQTIKSSRAAEIRHKPKDDYHLNSCHVWADGSEVSLKAGKDKD